MTNRKDEHVALAMAQHQTLGGNEFDLVRFVHQSLPQTTVANSDLRVQVLGGQWDCPFYLNGMTGGSAKTGEINRQLAIAAQETGIAIAAGSLSAYLKDASTAGSFQVLREENLHGFVMANVNANASVEGARAAVDLLKANALQIHINVAQETVMPEGDRAFAHWAERIEQIVAHVGVPVVVKEVGFGMSAQSLRQLHQLGVQWADVSGQGGTDFARIENARRLSHDFDYLLGWGQSAPASLAEAWALQDKPALLASGGVRNPLDVLRALALGAEAVGVSGHFLHVLMMQGLDALIAEIRRWQNQLRQLMALVGAHTVADLRQCDLILSGSLREYCELRGVNVAAFAQRSLAAQASAIGDN